MSQDDLHNLLPPGDDQVEQTHDQDEGLPTADDMPQGQAVLPPEPRQSLTDEDKQAIADHIDMVMQAGADVGADLMPPHLRDEFETAYTSSRVIRGVVTATGIGHALHELMPTDTAKGVGALPAPVQRIHPIARVALGVLVMGLSIAVQRRITLNGAHQQAAGLHPGGNGSGAGGSIGVQDGPNLWKGGGYRG